MNKLHSPRKSYTRSTPPTKSAAVIARRALGQTKTKIAADLGMSRNTVDSIIRESAIEQDWTAMRDAIIPVAFRAVQNQVDSGDGNLGMRYLEATALQPKQAKSFADNRLQMAVQTLILPTQAAEKPPDLQRAITVADNFSEITEATPKQLSFDFSASNEK